MNARDAINYIYKMSEMILNAYVGDLTDQEILVRPVENANHIAWQLGHLIQSEHNMIRAVCPGAMPTLPEGFDAKHTKDTAASDDPANFLATAEYLELYARQRAATKQALENCSDDDLDKPAPEQLQQICSNVAEIFNMQGVHLLMHCGQWATVRRKLGRPVQF